MCSQRAGVARLWSYLLHVARDEFLGGSLEGIGSLKSPPQRNTLVSAPSRKKRTQSHLEIFFVHTANILVQSFFVGLPRGPCLHHLMMSLSAPSRRNSSSAPAQRHYSGGLRGRDHCCCLPRFRLWVAPASHTSLVETPNLSE